MLFQADDPFSYLSVCLGSMAHTAIGFYIPLSIPTTNISLRKFSARFVTIFLIEYFICVVHQPEICGSQSGRYVF